jgi:hypothetical protein
MPEESAISVAVRLREYWHYLSVGSMVDWDGVTSSAAKHNSRRREYNESVPMA